MPPVAGGGQTANRRPPRRHDRIADSSFQRHVDSTPSRLQHLERVGQPAAPLVAAVAPDAAATPPGPPADNLHMPTVVVAGDMSGHVDVFRQLIRSVGGDPDIGTLPDDLIFIHTGDLVHKGPSSAECVELAGRLMARSPGRLLSIWGNHDAAYIAGAPPVTGRRLVVPVDPATATTLRRWWHQATLPLAVAVEAADGRQWLITHAGLTVGRWAALGRPHSAAAAAAALNCLVGVNPTLAFAGGLLTDGTVDPAAGSCWADTVHELLAPWAAHTIAGGQLPFGQIHGHASVVEHWYVDPPPLRADISSAVAQTVTVDPAARRYPATIGTQQIIGVDWILLDRPPATLTPLLTIDDATATV